MKSGIKIVFVLMLAAMPLLIFAELQTVIPLESHQGNPSNAGGEAVVQVQTGTLISVTPTGNGPDAQGRREYIVAIEIDGITYYFTIWMTDDEYAEMIKKIYKKITMKYKWVDGKRILVGITSF